MKELDELMNMPLTKTVKKYGNIPIGELAELLVHRDTTIAYLREEIACLKAELTKLNNWSDQLWKIVSPQDPATTDGISAMGTRSERQVVTSDPTSPAIDAESGLLSECEECNCQIKINRALLRKNNTLKSRALSAEAEVEKLKGSICNCKS